MQVVPIISTAVDWPTYLGMAKSILSRSITAELDVRSENPSGVRGLLATLGEMVNQGHSPGKEPGHLARHGYFGFMFSGRAETVFEIMEQTTLSVTSVKVGNRDQRLAVITGTIDKWRDAVINGCSNHAGEELRVFMDQCCLHLEAAGLSPLWYNYQKITLPDNTFRLEARR